jgi:hypothetical protein
MNRKDFLKIFGVGSITAPFIASTLMANTPDQSIQDIPDQPKLADSLDFTNELFRYMDSHPDKVDFLYRRQYNPVFEVNNVIYCVASHKLKALYLPDMIDDISLTLPHPYLTAEQEAINILMGYIVYELNLLYKNNPGTLHIYSLMGQQITFSPDNHTPRRHLHIRYAIA